MTKYFHLITLLLLLLFAGCSRVSPITDDTDSKSNDTSIDANPTDTGKLSDTDSRTDTTTDSQNDLPIYPCTDGTRTCINNDIYECTNNKYELYKECNNYDNSTDVCSSSYDYYECKIQADHSATCEIEDIAYDMCESVGSTYADCYSCAVGEITLCCLEYSECINDSSCAALDACIGGPDASSCVSQGLTGDAWEACEKACKNTATPETNALRETLNDCLYCKGCPFTKPEGAICVTESCDETSTDCYDPATGCWGCAMNTTCKTQVKACSDNPECAALDACISTNCYNSTDTEALSDSDYKTCKSNCETRHHDGVADLAAYHACIYCDACPVSCAEDAGDKCQKK